MAESESESAADPDRNARSFNVYVSTSVDLESALQIVRSDYTEDSEGLETQPAQGLTVQQICTRHGELAIDGGDIYTSLFLVIDSDEPERGVLAVNLSPYHGYADAVRKKQGEASDSIASLSISNTSWYEERDAAGRKKSPLLPEDWFALYNLQRSGSEESFQLAVKTMNDGVQEVNVDEDDTANAIPGPPFGLTKQYHRGVRPDSLVLEEVIDAHASFAERRDLDQAHFAVIDDRYEEEGALIVRTQPSQDSFRCKNPTAGELLGWIYINFMTWQEAKDFAARQ